MNHVDLGCHMEVISGSLWKRIPADNSKTIDRIVKSRAEFAGNFTGDPSNPLNDLNLFRLTNYESQIYMLLP